MRGEGGRTGRTIVSEPARKVWPHSEGVDGGSGGGTRVPVRRLHRGRFCAEWTGKGARIQEKAAQKSARMLGKGGLADWVSIDSSGGSGLVALDCRGPASGQSRGRWIDDGGWRAVGASGFCHGESGPVGGRVRNSSRRLFTRFSNTVFNLGSMSSIHTLVSSSFSGGSSIEAALLSPMVENVRELAHHHSDSEEVLISDSIFSWSPFRASNTPSVSSLFSI